MLAATHTQMAVPSNHWLSALALTSLTGCLQPTATTEPAPAATAELPAELRGTWLDSWSTSMEYSLATSAYDFDTHVWFGGRADLWDMAPYRGFGLSLGADGTFLWVRGEDGGVGGCQSYAVHVIKGSVTVEGSVLRFRPSAQRQRYESTCDPSLNFDRDVPNEDFTMPFTISATSDTGLSTLRLVDEASGATFVYFRQ